MGPEQQISTVLIIVFGCLGVIALFVPFYLFADATKRKKPALPWVAGAFFGLFIPAVLAVVFAVNENLVGFLVFGIIGFLTPFVLMFIYLILRSPAYERVCPECGNALQTSWRTCPYCEEARPGAPAPAMASAGPMFVPPPVGRNSGSTGTAIAGGRGGSDKSTMVKPREDKRTVRRRDKEAGPTLGWLVIKRGTGAGKEYKISKELTNIGRETANDIVLNDEESSRQHSRLRFEDDKFVLYDLGSANGTYVNGEEIQKAVLEDGDVVRVGNTEMMFKRV